jgi:hypothetical protein
VFVLATDRIAHGDPEFSARKAVAIFLTSSSGRPVIGIENEAVGFPGGLQGIAQEIRLLDETRVIFLPCSTRVGAYHVETSGSMLISFVITKPGKFCELLGERNDETQK